MRSRASPHADPGHLYGSGSGRAQVVGLVGELGCGKSAFGRIVAGLLEPSEGCVRTDGRERGALTGRQAPKSALKVQMILQNPMSSLNPRMRVAEIVGEAPRVHGLVARRETSAYVEDLLARVGSIRRRSAANRTNSWAVSASAPASRRSWR